MHYLFIGEDSVAKDKKIAELKKKYIPSPDALPFDFEILHGLKLEAELFKKSLIALPALSPKRLVVIHQAQKLSTQNKDLVVEFLQSKPEHMVLILDLDHSDPKDAFVNKIGKYVQVISLGVAAVQNVFDMTRAMSQRRLSEALLILTSLLSSGIQPVQIMGGLVWFWGKTKEKIPSQRFSQGLRALEEADLNIKRSRLKAEHALEMVVVKLSSLIAC